MPQTFRTITNQLLKGKFTDENTKNAIYQSRYFHTWKPIELRFMRGTKNASGELSQAAIPFLIVLADKMNTNPMALAKKIHNFDDLPIELKSEGYFFLCVNKEGSVIYEFINAEEHEDYIKNIVKEDQEYLMVHFGWTTHGGDDWRYRTINTILQQLLFLFKNREKDPEELNRKLEAW